MTRHCFTLRVRPEVLDEYRRRHAEVWPAMLEEIAASGRRDYSIFLGDDGLLVGYYETDDDAAATAYLAASAVAAEWEREMLPLFDGAAGRADQTARHLPEVFNLDAQLTASRGTPS